MYCLNNVHIIFITTYTRHDVTLVLNHCIHNRYMYIAQCVYIHRHTRAPREAV